MHAGSRSLVRADSYRQHGECAGVLNALRQVLCNRRAAVDDARVPGAPQAQELHGPVQESAIYTHFHF